MPLRAAEELLALLIEAPVSADDSSDEVEYDETLLDEALRCLRKAEPNLTGMIPRVEKDRVALVIGETDVNHLIQLIELDEEGPQQHVRFVSSILRRQIQQKTRGQTRPDLSPSGE